MTLALVYTVGLIVALTFIILLAIVFEGWRNTKATRGKMIAEIWEQSGFPVRNLVDISPDGKTVEVDGCTYALPKEPTKAEAEKSEHYYPSRRYVLWGRLPVGKVTLRIDSWEKDNPEPIRPCYDKPVVTALEWTAQKRAIQATAIAFRIQESEARQKELEKSLANQPSKMVVYLGIGFCIAIGIGTLFYAMQNSGLLQSIATGLGLSW